MIDKWMFGVFSPSVGPGYSMIIFSPTVQWLKCRGLGQMAPTVMCVCKCLWSSSQDSFAVCPRGCVCEEVRLVGL